MSSFVFGFIRLDPRRVSLQLCARSAIGGSHRKVKRGHEPSLYSKTRNQVCQREASINVKPFIETLRVTNPVRQSRASSREASLAWGRVTVTGKRRQRDQQRGD